MKLLLSAKQRGSTNVLAPVAKELLSRGHQVSLYATGNETEAAGFNGLDYKHGAVGLDDFTRLVRDNKVVVVGLSGYGTPDSQFLKAANAEGIPTVAVQDQNSNYVGRLGTNPADLPNILAVMSDDCIETARRELGGEMGNEAAKRCRTVGWPAFDHYAALRESFTEVKRRELLGKLGLNPEKPVYFHATQNGHPLSDYSLSAIRSEVVRDWEALSAKLEKLVKDKGAYFDYEMRVTETVFQAASDLGLRLVVKPHPGEKYAINFTEDLAKRHGFFYVPAEACNTQQLMLASYSVTAGRSTCLTEATLLNRNTGAMLPDELGKIWGTTGSPAISLDAIPVAYEWDHVIGILAMVTSHNTAAQMLAENRKKFSVDGNASKRLADLIEGLK